MAAVCPPRRALVEIPAPQPKIAARMRRSYLEILSARLAPSPLQRRRGAAANSRRPQAVDLPVAGAWGGRIEEHCEKMDEHQAPLSKQQLVQLIRSLVLVEQSQEPRVLASDLKYLQEDLQLKKANVFRSIPYSRLGSNRDAHCYRKAYPHLVAFKVSCQEWGQVLLRNKEWDAALEHTLMAWRYTSELPRWDTASHNALREQCFSLLAAHSLTALQHYRPEPGRGRELLRRLKMAQLHSRSIAPCIQELQGIVGRAVDRRGTPVIVALTAGVTSNSCNLCPRCSPHLTPAGGAHAAPWATPAASLVSGLGLQWGSGVHDTGCCHGSLQSGLELSGKRKTHHLRRGVEFPVSLTADDEPVWGKSHWGLLPTQHRQ